MNCHRTTSNGKNKYFTVRYWQYNTYSRLCHLIQACSQGITVSKAWYPYSRDNRRKYLRLCSKQGFKAFIISTANIFFERSLLGIITTIWWPSRHLDSLKNMFSYMCFRSLRLMWRPGVRSFCFQVCCTYWDPLWTTATWKQILITQKRFGDSVNCILF